MPKTATISDLFTPMKSIETCIISTGDKMNGNLSSINDTVLNCASNLNKGANIIRNASNKINKTIVDSFKSLEQVTEKTIVASATSGVGITQAVTESISVGIENIGTIVNAISEQMSSATKTLEKIEGNLGKGNDKFFEKKKEKIEVPDVSGGEGLSPLVETLVNAATTINEITLPQSITFKIKAKNIIKGILGIIKTYEKELTPAKAKEYDETTKSLAGISDSLKDIVKNMAVTNIIAIPAMIGVKLSKKIIKSIISVIQPLADLKNAKQMQEGARTLSGIAKAILKFDAAMALSVILVVPAAAGIALNFFLIKGAIALFNMLGMPKHSIDLKKGITNIGLMGLSILSFTLSLLASTMIMKYLLMGKENNFDGSNLIALGCSVLSIGLMLGVYNLYSMIGSSSSIKSAKNGAIAINLMSSGIILFSLSMLVSYLVTKTIIGNSMKDGKFDATDFIAIISIVPIFLLMWGSYKLYSKLGAPKSVKKALAGGVAVLMMSVGLIMFSLSLIVTNSLVKNLWKTENGKADWLSMAKTVAIFGLMFVSLKVFEAIGKKPVQIMKGVGVSLLMTVGIAAFGFGLKLCTDSIKGFSFTDLLMIPGLISLFAVEFGVMGIEPVAIAIASGAGAFIVASGAILVFGTAIEKMKEPLRTVPMESFFKLSEVIKAVGTTFASMGLISVPMGIGAGAMTIAAGAVLLLVDGLKEWSKVKITEDQLNLLCTSIDRIKLAFQGDPDGSSKNNGFFKKLGGAISGALTAPFDTVKIAASASALAIAGGAIKTLTEGLAVWQNAKIKEDTVAGMAKTLGMLRDTFASIGAKKGEQKSSLLKSLIGVDFGNFELNDVARGAKITKKMGKALTEISKGLVEWEEGIGYKFKDNKFMTDFTESVSICITSLSDAFKQVGQAYENEPVTSAKTLFGKIWQDLTVNTFGSTKTQNFVETGINAVKNLGKTIKDIAEGLKEFKDIVPNGKTSWITDVAAGLSALLNGIQEPLIAFGTTDESYSTALNKASAKAAAYSNAMSSIHDISSQTTNFEHHKVDVASALEHIGNIGDMVKGLAEGVKIMADPRIIANIGTAGKIKEGSFEFESEGTGMIYNIQKLVCSQLSIFIELGKKIQELGVYEIFHDEVVEDVKKGMFGRESKTTKAVRVSGGMGSYLGMAVEASVNIGNVIRGLAEGYEKMNSVFPSDSAMISGVSRVTKAMNAIMVAWSRIGKTIVGDLAGESIELVPASMGMPELSSAFGYTSEYLSILNIKSDEVGNPFVNATKNIETTMTAVVSTFESVSKSSKDVTNISNNSAKFMQTFANVANMAMIMSNHESDFVLHEFSSNGKRTEYKLDMLYGDMLTQAGLNAETIKGVSNKLVSVSNTLSSLNPKSGTIFVSFANNMVKGMNVLAGANANITKATKFMNTLNFAHSKGVFNNIAENTAKIASSINSIDNAVFEPYAKMIESFGKMSDNYSEFYKMQKDLYELLEKIIDKINETGKTTGTQVQTQQVKTINKQEAKEPQKPQQITAKLSSDTVKVDGKQFLRDLEELLSNYKGI